MIGIYFVSSYFWIACMKEDGSMWDFQVKQSREGVKKIFLGDMSPKLRPSPLSAILEDKKD